MALVYFAKKCGFEFLPSSEGKIKVRELEKEKEYELLEVLEFNSDRKRMSVIIRDSDNKIKLYCKGADNMILQRSKKIMSNGETTKTLREKINEFAN